MLLSVLLWNIDRRPIYDRCAVIANDQRVDVVVVLECDSPANLVLSLNQDQEPPEWFPAGSASGHVAVATRFSPSFMKTLSVPTGAEQVAARTTAHVVKRPLDPEPGVLLVATHLPDPRNRPRPEDRQSLHESLSRFIGAAERVAGHDRTIVMGDLNDDPWAPSVVHAAGLHGMMTRETANRGQRTVDGVERRFFFNPMWRHLADDAPGPPGTFYRDKSDSVSYYWHTLDQVLFRPSLLAGLDDALVRVLGRDDYAWLQDEEPPHKPRASDHLPVVFAIETEVRTDHG